MMMMMMAILLEANLARCGNRARFAWLCLALQCLQGAMLGFNEEFVK